ncbi:DUF1758 domain-containing protein [Trichonephila clavipes]|nr:DUF1758 domain-containing protein [Trichonephila clavipes]
MAEFELDCVFGHVITKAAVLKDSLDRGRYLLGNKTAVLFEEVKKNKEIHVYMVNAVETRSQKKLTEEKGQSKMDIPELQAQLDSVLNIKQKYEAPKEEYYRISKEKEFQKVEASIYEVDHDIQKLEVSHKTSINKLKSIKIQNETENYINNEHSKKPLFKLPKIPLPYFSGKIEEWSLFKTQFNSIISENAELSENEKLYYLRGSLKGEAKIVETAGDTFHSLFKALEQRYENKSLMVNCHIKNIFNIQPLKHESGKDLRYVLDTILKNLKSLKILEFERDKLSDALLLNIILDKLDRDSHKQYELTLKDNNVHEFDDFLEILE